MRIDKMPVLQAIVYSGFVQLSTLCVSPTELTSWHSLIGTAIRKYHNPGHLDSATLSPFCMQLALLWSSSIMCWTHYQFEVASVLVVQHHNEHRTD